jgi:hypothetical protein
MAGEDCSALKELAYWMPYYAATTVRYTDTMDEFGFEDDETIVSDYEQSLNFKGDIHHPSHS